MSGYDKPPTGPQLLVIDCFPTISAANSYLHKAYNGRQMITMIGYPKIQTDSVRLEEYRRAPLLFEALEIGRMK